MSTSRSTLRGKLADKMRTRGISGTCTSNTVTTSVCDTGRDEENDYWNKSWITVNDTSASVIETREINDFTTGASGGTGKFDVLQAFSAAPTTGDTYELHQKFSVDELNDAINQAIVRAAGKITTKNSATTTSSTSVYAYTLSTAATKVFDVRLQADSSIATAPYYKMLKWRLQPGASTPTLQFNQPIDSGLTIRYFYTTDPTELASDTATTDLSTAYIYDAARVELYDVLASDAQDDNEFRRYMTKADDFDRRAERLLRRYSTQAPAKRALKETGLLGGEGWYEVTYGKGSLE